MISNIREAWKINRYEFLSKELNEEINKGVTGGEMISNVAGFLVNVKMSNNMAYNVVKDDIEMYLDYCYSIGIRFEKE